MEASADVSGRAKEDFGGSKGTVGEGEEGGKEFPVGRGIDSLIPFSESKL
jgi:hypothetical protein